MTIIPAFMLKKIYKKGSLRHIEEGIAFDLKNILAPGFITGINFVKLNDTLYDSSFIKIIKSGAAIIAEHISSENPMMIKLNEDITCILKKELDSTVNSLTEPALELKQGINNIIVELISLDAGRVQVNLSDTV